jgi:flagellar basal body-associated protein FliL
VIAMLYLLVGLIVLLLLSVGLLVVLAYAGYLIWLDSEEAKAEQVLQQQATLAAEQGEGL